MKTKVKARPTLAQIKTVKEWANSIATEDNDIVQIRKKNGIIYVMKTEVCRSSTWERLDPADEPVIVDVHGKNLEEKLGNSDAEIVDATTLSEKVKKVKPKPIPKITTGWYQDSMANLFKYEGKGIWDTPEKDWEKLLNLADSGTLEYIG